MFFESHAHYDDERYDGDRDALLSSLKESGVDTVINVGADMPSSYEGIKLAEKYDFIYTAVGVHPHEANKVVEEDYARLLEMTKHDKVVALGEIGLDFYYDHSPRDIQRKVFKTQLELVERTGLPVIIHSRDASEETFNTIKDSKVRHGVIHCFSGSKETALEYVKMGFKIGIGGVVTFKKARSIIEVVDALPLENILIETDCPYLSPEPFRGARNDSAKLKFIAKKIAEIKNLTLEEISQITSDNAKSLFFWH